MGENKVFFNQKPLNAAEQLLSLKSSNCKIITHSFDKTRLSCTLELKPNDYSRIYKLKVVYDLGITKERKAKVWVINPQLTLPEDLKSIHMFPDKSLCLYYMKEWTPSKPIGKTIIPWAALWLCYYEYWELFGTWEGGGIHPSNDKKTKPHTRI